MPDSISPSISQRIDFAQGLACEAGALALEYFAHLDRLTQETKGPQDTVSEADRAVEAFIRNALAERFAGDGFLGEESGSSAITGGGPIWVVDPIDGTQCFLSGIASWCVSIGLVYEGRIVGGVIRDPCHEETFTAAAGAPARCNGRPMRPSKATDWTDGFVEVGWSPRVPPKPTVQFIASLLERGGIYRRCGAGALGLAYVADGRYLGYFEGHMNIWDSCAGAALVQAAGGWVNDVLANDGLHQGSLVLAGGPGLAGPLRALARETGHDV